MERFQRAQISSPGRRVGRHRIAWLLSVALVLVAPSCAGEERGAGPAGSGPTASSVAPAGDPGAGTVEQAGSGTTGTDPPPTEVPTTEEPTTATTTVAVPVTTLAAVPTTVRVSVEPARRPTVTLSTKRAPSGPGVPAIPRYEMSREEALFFECVVERESSGNPYAINAESGAAGLYQFLQSTWDMVAVHLGRPDLVGVNPALAPIPLQRWFAHELFLWQGTQPWLADGCQLPPPLPTVPPETTTTEAPPPAPPADPLEPTS